MRAPRTSAMWDVVFQPFWISGKSGHESFRDTSVEREGKKKNQASSDGGVSRCLFGCFFAVAARVPGGRIATSHLDVTPPHILARASTSQGDWCTLIVCSLDRVTEWRISFELDGIQISSPTPLCRGTLRVSITNSPKQNYCKLSVSCQIRKRNYILMCCSSNFLILKCVSFCYISAIDIRY